MHKWINHSYFTRGQPLFQNLLAHIQEKNVPCLFLSSHLSDISASCAELFQFIASRTHTMVFAPFSREGEVTQEMYPLQPGTQHLLLDFQNSALSTPEGQKHIRDVLLTYLHTFLLHYPDSYFFVPLAARNEREHLFLRSFCETVLSHRCIYYFSSHSLWNLDMRFIIRHHLLPALFAENELYYLPAHFSWQRR